MNTPSPKAWFLILLSVAALALLLVVYQVPQPWRGYLVAWLLFMATAGTFVLRLVQHHYHYKALQLTSKQNGHSVPPPPRRPKPGPPPTGALKVVYSEQAGSGRHIIR
jgi:hypothetical protein